jgi:UDP-N-acetylmuramoyl-L-alanyl-D-glutamate--2,6-diaminopimelate ligase
MKLSDILLQSEVVSGYSSAVHQLTVTAITCDSREVKPGALYFCILGAKYDGRVFVQEAFKRGAIGVVHEGDIGDAVPGVALKVKDVRRSLSLAAHRFFGTPSQQLRNIAVTGTSGKTSVAWILSHSLRQLGEPTFIGGTLAFKILEESDGVAPKLQELSNTTMDPVSVHRFLAQAVKDGAKASVFEATSQGVIQSRMADVAWDGAIFTNLSRDHMDLHGTMEKYEGAKRRLFVEDLVRSPKAKKFALFNFDDAAGRRIGCELKVAYPEIRTVSLSRSNEEGADYVIDALDASIDGLSFVLKGKCNEVNIAASLIGLHNAYNLGLAAIALLELGYSATQVKEALAHTPAVPGRLEPVKGTNRKIYVDYAHKPDALEKVLSFLKPLCRGRLICIMGCGGDRDKGKRPVMGEISRRLADITVVTSDNPRSEDPDEILRQIVSGIPAKEGYPLIVEVDRRTAIRKAIEVSTAEDVVVIAGKGHEPYQEIMGVKHPFHDAEVARALLVG